MVTKQEAQKALDRLYDNCEEIDNNLPEAERTGYNMLEDYWTVSRFIREVNDDDV